MEPKSVTVRTWQELNDWLYEGSWQEHLGRFRPSIAFRGMPCADWNLKAGVTRWGNASTDLEGATLRAFRKYAFEEKLPGDTIWNWLALAQHHGLPTRLLDWTYSPFVAMHFVTEKFKYWEEDGIIWSVDFRVTNTLLPKALQDVLESERSDVFTADMLCRAADTLEEFDALSDDPFVAFFEPPSLDARIVNQYALFSLVSRPDLPLDDWLAARPGTGRRVVIPAALKQEIRDKLDQGNITERVLYPGLDGLSRWLRRYYRLVK